MLTLPVEGGCEAKLRNSSHSRCCITRSSSASPPISLVLLVNVNSELFHPNFGQFHFCVTEEDRETQLLWIM